MNKPATTTQVVTPPDRALKAQPAPSEDERITGGKRFVWNDERLDSILASMATMRPVGKTGICSLDRLLGGGLYPEVYVLAAEPGAGKTTLALQIADYVARFGSRKTVFLSAEMSAAQIVAKSLSRLSSEGGNDPLTAREVMRMDESMLARITATANLYRTEIAPNTATIDKKLTVEQITSLYREGFPSSDPQPVLVVDYLQIIPATDDAAKTDFQHHTANMGGLVDIAKQHKTPVLVISSMNRSGRSASSLVSLSGSSAIEYGASVVMFVSVDGSDDEAIKENKSAPMRPVTLSVLKNRFGNTGDISLYFKPAENRFMEKAER